MIPPRYNDFPERFHYKALKKHMNKSSTLEEAVLALRILILQSIFTNTERNKHSYFFLKRQKTKGASILVMFIYNVHFKNSNKSFN